MKIKKQIKYIFGTAVFLAIAAVLLTLTTYVMRPTDKDFFRARVAGFYAEDRDSLDVVGFGSSALYRYLNSPLLWKQQGITSYGIATAAQPVYVIPSLIDEVEKTQSDDAAASTLIKIMEESEYNQVTGEQVELEPGQALVFQAKQKNYGYDTIELGNQMYEVKKWNTNKKSYILDEKTQVYETMTVVTRNHEAKEAYAAVQGKEPEGYSWEYALDLIGDAGEQITVGDEIETILTESSFNGWVEVREKERNTVYSLYGSLLFLGVFVGALFLMGAVMIIYYKQVSEGFDDRKRFQIMQKVGMSRKEIRQTIQSQVVTVFFLPLAVAVVHTMVAFPLTKRIMAMLNFPDSNLFLAATAITIAAFAVVYLIVYVLTARAYYKIVE